MKILDKVQEIEKRYGLKPIELPAEFKNVYHFLNKYPEFREDFVSEKTDSYFCVKYKNHIPRGWYGFSIGDPIVPTWNNIIEEILDICIEADPNFEIHQIKIKFGGVRFYCGSEVIEDLMEVERLVENSLWDAALIY